MKLTTRWNVGGLTFKNRMVMAPFKTALAHPGGEVSEATVQFYRRAAQGGVAMIITEPMAVLPSGREHPKQLAIDHDRFIEGVQRMVLAVHKAGALACCHLNHAGRAANPKAAGGQPVAPSPVPCPASGQKPRELEPSEIEEIVEAFGAAAARAWWAGYDAIEVQLGHGYLAAQFFSERTNQRTDQWGGSLENRLRFVREVLRAVRTATHNSIPVMARISGDEMVENGISPAGLRPFLELLEEEGVFALHVGMGSACDTPPWYYHHMSLPTAPQERALEAIAGETSLPLVGAGRLGDPDRMERLLSGPLKLVALARPLVADPELPRKIVEGRSGEIVYCGSCLQGCLLRVKSGGPIGCVANPAAGRPGEAALEPAEQPLRVMVVGGGPAGITAAVTLAKRGHRVTLCEREPELGGQFRLAPLAPGKERMEKPLRSLIAQLESSPVEVRTGTEVTPELVAGLRPDAVILATGARPVVPHIEGLDSVRVLSGTELFASQPPIEGSVLVIGGGMIGMEAAEFLAERGVEVTVVELLEDIARDMEPVTRKLLLRRISSLPVTVYTSTEVRRLSPRGVELVGSDGARRTQLPTVAAVIYAVGTRPENRLAEAIRELGIHVEIVGDAAEPRQVIGAVESGWEAARRLSA